MKIVRDRGGEFSVPERAPGERPVARRGARPAPVIKYTQAPGKKPSEQKIGSDVIVPEPRRLGSGGLPPGRPSRFGMRQAAEGRILFRRGCEWIHTSTRVSRR